MILVTLNWSLSYDGRNVTEEKYDLDYVVGDRNLVDYNLGVNNGYCFDYSRSWNMVDMEVSYIENERMDS